MKALFKKIVFFLGLVFIALSLSFCSWVLELGIPYQNTAKCQKLRDNLGLGMDDDVDLDANWTDAYLALTDAVSAHSKVHADMAKTNAVYHDSKFDSDLSKTSAYMAKIESSRAKTYLDILQYKCLKQTKPCVEATRYTYKTLSNTSKFFSDSAHAYFQASIATDEASRAKADISIEKLDDSFSAEDWLKTGYRLQIKEHCSNKIMKHLYKVLNYLLLSTNIIYQ